MKPSSGGVSSLTKLKHSYHSSRPTPFLFPRGDDGSELAAAEQAFLTG